jgi:hypothetical protein
MTTLHKDLVGTNLHDPKPHTHTESEVTDLGSYADASHTHVEADITDLGTYLTETAADLLYEPLGGGGTDPAVIPHYNKGTGDFHAIVLFGTAIWAGEDPATARVSVRDMVHLLKGGVAVPSYSFDIRPSGGSWVGANADPTAVYLDLSYNDGPQAVIEVRCSDGTTSVDTETFVSIGGSGGAP